MQRARNWLRLVFATALAVPAISLVLPEDELIAAVPSRSSVSPVDGATNVSPTTNLTITFNIPVTQGTGSIELKKVNNPFAFQSFDVATSTSVTGWGTSTITITLSELSKNTAYYVNYPATAFKDAGSSDYATAVSDSTTWNFTTSGVPWGSGDGTSGSPWQITNCLELTSIDSQSTYWNDYFIVANNIDCSGTTVLPMKIGTGSSQFTGQINGNNKTISNLTISCVADFGCGLFAKVSSGASFSNLTLSTVNINQTSSTYYLVGSLFGSQSGTLGAAVTVSNITATGLNISNANSFSGGIAGDCATCVATNISTAGNITGKTQVGGIFGRLGSSTSTVATLSNSSSSATIVATMSSTSSTQSTGGLIGSYPMNSSATTANRTLSDLTFSGSVTGDSYDIGGIIGDADNAVLEDVVSTGTVTGFDDVGGIVGDLTSSTISTSRTSGTVHATRTDNCSGQVGGLAGTFASSTISRSFSTATVKGHCRLGGLIGGATPSPSSTFLSDSYFVGALVQTSAGTYAGNNMGGLIGLTNATATIARSYAVATSVSNASSGVFRGLIGGRYSGSQTLTCSNVFWDKEITSLTTDGVCGSTPGKTTSEMKTQGTFTGFDFSTVWSIASGVNSGYPTLQAFSTATIPVAPTITSVTAGDGTLTVAFTAGSDGGSAINNYEYSTNGTTYTTLSPTSTTSPITITGLINGTSYPITIKAVNGIGASNASNSVSGTPVASTPSTTTPPTTAAPATPAAPESTTTTSLPTVTRTLTITGAAARYIVTQAGPGLTAVPSDGDGSISWSSLTPSVCNVSSIAMMSILSAQSSIEVGRLSVVGTCTISATVAATSTHSSASTSVSFSVTRARPSLVVDTFDDEHFFAKLTLPAAISGSTALLRSMYEDLRFVVLTPEICEIETIATFQESGSRFGSSWVGLHGAPNYLSDGACAVRAELPLGDRWFRVFSITNATLGEDVEPTTTTATPTTTSTIAPSTTVAPTTTVSATTTVPETTSSAPGITSFGPTSTIATAPVVELDVEKQIVLETGETEIVFTRESLIKTAENVGVRVGAIRLRTASSAWTETKLPDATNLSLVIRRSDVELNIEVAPEVGDVIRIAVPIVINVDGGFGLRNFTLAFLAGASLMAWWLLVWRRRRLVKPVA